MHVCLVLYGILQRSFRPKLGVAYLSENEATADF